MSFDSSSSIYLLIVYSIDIVLCVIHAEASFRVRLLRIHIVIALGLVLANFLPAEVEVTRLLRIRVAIAARVPLLLDRVQTRVVEDARLLFHRVRLVGKQIAVLFVVLTPQVVNEVGGHVVGRVVGDHTNHEDA